MAIHSFMGMLEDQFCGEFMDATKMEICCSMLRIGNMSATRMVGFHEELMQFEGKLWYACNFALALQPNPEGLMV